MTHALGCVPERMSAAIGPAIGPCCYTVGPEVADRVPADARAAVITLRAGEIRLDLAGLNAWWLRAGGLQPARIFQACQCTACLPDRYHSYRKRGAAAGRMMAVIAIRAADRPADGRS